METQKQYIPVVLALCTILVLPGVIRAFDYDNQEAWPGFCQTGHKQSPIPLKLKEAIRREFNPLIFEGYDIPRTVTVKNNGHTALCTFEDAETLAVGGGGLAEKYFLTQFHFHWRSEHTINDIRYPLEMHLVYQSSNNQTAVFGVLFHLSPDDYEGIEQLIYAVANINGEYNGQQQTEQFVLSDLLPQDRAGFYRYRGSLTTPNCDEGIIWTVFTNTVPISRRQVIVFQSLRDSRGQRITFNYRVLQAINNRKVFLKRSPDFKYDKL